MKRHRPLSCVSANDIDRAGFLANTPENLRECRESLARREPIDPVIKKTLVREGIVDADYPIISALSRKR